MNNTNQTATDVFLDLVRGFQLVLGVDIEGETPGQLLVSLGEAAKRSAHVKSSVQSLTESPVHFAKRFDRDGSLMDKVVKTVFAAALRASIHVYGPMGAPKRQHWMPVAYLKAFDPNGAEKKHKATIPGVSFSEGYTMGFLTQDTNFIHPMKEGVGFYEDSAEYFFHLIENFYGQGRSNKTYSLIAPFFIVQSVRNPYRSEFRYSRFADILDAILLAIDELGPDFRLRISKSNKPLPFTPYMPPSITQTQKARIYSFPISPKLLFSISTNSVHDSVWSGFTDRYGKRVIERAKRKGGFIFGLQKSDLAMWGN